MPDIQQFTMSDYRSFGRRHGFRYGWPKLDSLPEPELPLTLAQGSMIEIPVNGGFTLVVSDIINHYAYSASSLISPGFTSILMLDGHAEAELSGTRTPLNLARNRAITASHGQTESMTGHHPSGLRLRSVALLARRDNISPDAFRHVSELECLLDGQLHIHHWQANPALLQAANSLFDDAWQGSLGKLWQEGVALQLLSCALSAATAGRNQRAPQLCARDRTRLERVRELLLTHPEREHSLADLAELACMSSSSLRQKFQAAYGQSVFVFLRECRLQLACKGLREEGWSVEQAAERTGYRHASNFTAAFRRRFGAAPSQW